ncbi:MAG: hypothetical protein AAB647_02935, partial [Patescibacteria group bacterium]
MSRFPRLPKVRCQKRPDGFFDLPPPQFCEQRQFDVERHFGGVNIDDTGDVADCGLQTEGACRRMNLKRFFFVSELSP